MAFGAVQFAYFNGAGGGAQTLATPRTGSRIVLLSYLVSARGTGTAGVAIFRSAATDKFSVSYPGNAGGAAAHAEGTRDAPLMETVVNEALVVNTPATDVSVRVSYIDSEV